MKIERPSTRSDAAWRQIELENRRKPRAKRREFVPPQHTPWFGRCPAFRPRTDADANRETRL